MKWSALAKINAQPAESLPTRFEPCTGSWLLVHLGAYSVKIFLSFIIVAERIQIVDLDIAPTQVLSGTYCRIKHYNDGFFSKVKAF